MMGRTLVATRFWAIVNVPDQNEPPYEIDCFLAEFRREEAEFDRVPAIKNAWTSGRSRLHDVHAEREARGPHASRAASPRWHGRWTRITWAHGTPRG